MIVQTLQIFGHNKSYFHKLEVVGHSSQTQLQMGENIN